MNPRLNCPLDRMTSSRTSKPSRGIGSVTCGVSAIRVRREIEEVVDGREHLDVGIEVHHDAVAAIEQRPEQERLQRGRDSVTS